MKFYTSFEAAKELGVTPVTLKRWRENGRFVPVQITAGGHHRYSDEQIENAKKGIFSSTNLNKLLG